jgi:hypothetical protein
MIVQENPTPKVNPIFLRKGAPHLPKPVESDLPIDEPDQPDLHESWIEPQAIGILMAFIGLMVLLFHWAVVVQRFPQDLIHLF